MTMKGKRLESILDKTGIAYPIKVSFLSVSLRSKHSLESKNHLLPVGVDLLSRLLPILIVKIHM